MFSELGGWIGLLVGHSIILVSGACVVFLGRPKRVALWRRIIMWVVGTYVGIGGIMAWYGVASWDGIENVYPTGVRLVAIIYISSIFIGRW